MAYTQTFVGEGWAVDVDTTQPLVAAAMERGYDSWIEDGIEFLTEFRQNHPSLSEAEALEQLNAGSTWILLRRATPEEAASCSFCGAALVNEDCPNYGHGPEHAEVER
jgi:hypothetical protein